MADEKKFDQNKYIQNYVKENYSHVHFTCRPEIKEELMRKAKTEGLTLSQYLIKKGLE
jgi:hypothetical protein